MLFIFALLSLASSPARAAENKLVWKWVSANEYYFIPPTPQNLYLPGNNNTVVVHPWGLGVRATGSGEGFSKTGGLQLQSVKAANRSLPESASFYILDLLLGMDYMTPKAQGKPLRFTASALGDIGLSDTTLFIAPVLSAGLLYTTDENAETPTGLTFTIFYRPVDIDLDNVGGGKSGTLKSAIGFKLGYLFEGFWTPKEKSHKSSDKGGFVTPGLMPALVK